MSHKCKFCENDANLQCDLCDAFVCESHAYYIDEKILCYQCMLYKHKFRLCIGAVITLIVFTFILIAFFFFSMPVEMFVSLSVLLFFIFGVVVISSHYLLGLQMSLSKIIENKEVELKEHEN